MIKRIIKIYGFRMERNIWLNEDSCNHHESGPQEMTLRDFGKKRTVGKCTTRRNVLCSYLKSNYVPKFYQKKSKKRDVTAANIASMI